MPPSEKITPHYEPGVIDETRIVLLEESSVPVTLTFWPEMCVGILGEYIGRVYDEVRQRPLSIINRIYRTEQLFTSPQVGPELIGQMKEGGRKKVFPAA